MQNLVAWSYSRLTSYEQCPKKYYALSVAKSVKEEENEATSFGTQVHLSFANYLKTGKPLPLHLRHFERYLKPIKNTPGEHVIEQQIALNDSWEPTDWFSKDTYLRVISDVTILNGSNGLLIDWKTGKMYDDFTQLKLVGAVTFILAPEIETLRLAYFWTKTKQLTSDSLKRDDVEQVWASILPRVETYQEAHVKQEFPPRPNYLCKKYCPVKACPFWGV